MDITWYGHSCFRIAERGQTTVVTDPYHGQAVGLPELKVKGDIVTISQMDDPAFNHAEGVRGYNYVLEGPGEYEFGGTFVWAVPLHHMEGDKAYRNVGYHVRYDDGLSVLHLGKLNYIPDQSVIQDLGDIHVLLLPVGGASSLRPAMAAEVVALVEPSYVVPMQYALEGMTLALDGLEGFLKAMGISKVEEEESLRISLNGLPEQPQVVILQPNIGE